MTNKKNVLNEKFVVISVMGSHAGESETEIFHRKIEDIKRVGKTFWLIKSYKAKPEMVQVLFNQAKSKGKEVFAIFIEASSQEGAVPTKIADTATHYSKDMINWEKLPNGLSPVTGKMDRGAYALVFDQLELSAGEVNLWNYANFFEQDQPIKIAQGASTLCAIKKDMTNHPAKIRSNKRKIIAIGKICKPGGVWLKK